MSLRTELSPNELVIYPDELSTNDPLLSIQTKTKKIEGKIKEQKFGKLNELIKRLTGGITFNKLIIHQNHNYINTTYQKFSIKEKYKVARITYCKSF